MKFLIQVIYSVDCPERRENVETITGFFNKSFPEQDILLKEYVSGKKQEIEYTSERIIHDVVPDSKSFSLSKQRNDQIDFQVDSKYDFLMIMDQDCIVNPNSVNRMISILSEDNKYTWGYPHNGFMGYTKRDASVLKDIKNGKFPNMHELIQCNIIRLDKRLCCKSASYLFNLTKKIPERFLEEYTAWGAEDVDYFMQTKQNDNCPIRIDGELFHIDHPKKGSFYKKLDYDKIFKRRYGMSSGQQLKIPEIRIEPFTLHLEKNIIHQSDNFQINNYQNTVRQSPHLDKNKSEFTMEEIMKMPLWRRRKYLK